MPKNRTFLSKLASAGNALFDTPWLEQFAAICYRPNASATGREILLITARGSGRWVIPKGSPMKGKSPHEVAEQEAFEEAGVTGRIGKRPIGHYTYLKRQIDGRSSPCVVQVFALEVIAVAENFKEQGQRQLKWVPFAEAARMVEEPELRGLIAGLEPSLRTGES